ncbi:MAG TPA: hypothetical protein VF956_06080, partial [Candidatus Dormibacteraeota bacterium]
PATTGIPASTTADYRGNFGLSGLHEVALERPDRRCGPGTRARLVEDVLDVVAIQPSGGCAASTRRSRRSVTINARAPVL